MKILVLGASSFYGSNFCRIAAERGEEVIRLSRPDWNLGDPIPEADCVVNFASRSLVPESWDDPLAYVMSNSVFTSTLVNAKCERFVHVSTPEVYGHTQSIVREGAPFNPSTPYAVSRAAADMMFMAYHKAKGFPVIITRTANIYGYGQPDHRFIPLAFKTLRAGKKLVLDGGGRTIRGFIHVRDACEATYLICKKGVIGETYHIATQGVLTIEALASMICSRLGLNAHEWIEAGQDRLGKDLAYILDSSKVRALGWCNRVTLKEGLEEYGTGGIHPADYKTRHTFSDHQHCLKCGKWEGDPEADDCVMSDREYENLRKSGKEPPWKAR